MPRTITDQSFLQYSYNMAMTSFLFLFGLDAHHCIASHIHYLQWSRTQNTVNGIMHLNIQSLNKEFVPMLF